MSAEHRAPTQVTIASTQDETDLHRWVQSYWKHAVGLAVLITAAIIVKQEMGQRSEASALGSWERLSEEVPRTAFGQLTPPDPVALAALAGELDGQPAAPWAKGLEIGKHLEAEDFDAALRALDELEAGWPDHPLVTDPLYAQEDGPDRTLREHIEAGIREFEAFEASNASLFRNPAPAEDAPRVRLTTSRGDVVIALYPDAAPQHVENFLTLCRDGFYDGTKFHRIQRGQFVAAGDPNSREGDPETWGEGGPEETLEPELGSLWHFQGSVSAERKPGAAGSHGSQFTITTADLFSRDGRYTVFGTVVEGVEVVTQIESGTEVGGVPQDPVAIESVEVL